MWHINLNVFISCELSKSIEKEKHENFRICLQSSSTANLPYIFQRGTWSAELVSRQISDGSLPGFLFFQIFQLVINDLFHFCTTTVSPKRAHQVLKLKWKSVSGSSHCSCCFDILIIGHHCREKFDRNFCRHVELPFKCFAEILNKR